MSDSSVQVTISGNTPHSQKPPSCYSVWSDISDALATSNASMPYEFRPEHAGRVLTLAKPAWNLTRSCLVEYLPFRPVAFTFLLVVLVAALCGNATVFAALYTNRRRWGRVNHFLIYLCLADLAVLVTPLVELFTMAARTWYGGRSLCKLYRVLSAFGLYLSSFMVASIAVDRYAAVTRPQSVRTAARRSRLMLAASVIGSVVCSMPQATVFDVFESNFFKGYNLVCLETFAADQLKNKLYRRWFYNLFAFLIMYGLPFVTITWCYSRIMCVLNLKTKEHQEHCVCLQSNSQPESADSIKRLSTIAASALGCSAKQGKLRSIETARMHTLKMTVIIVLAFLFCWAPYWIVTLAYTFHLTGGQKAPNTELVYMCLTFAFSNSCVNPIIYGLFTRHCRSCLRRLRATTTAGAAVAGPMEKSNKAAAAVAAKPCCCKTRCHRYSPPLEMDNELPWRLVHCHQLHSSHPASPIRQLAPAESPSSSPIRPVLDRCGVRLTVSNDGFDAVQRASSPSRPQRFVRNDFHSNLRTKSFERS